MHVFRLRKALSAAESPGTASPITTVGTGYQLHVAPGHLDINDFDNLSHAAAAAMRAGNANAADESAARALALWRGPALADLPVTRFVDDLASALEDRRLSVTELKVDAGLALGRSEQVIAFLRPLTHEHPLREGLTARLMTALYQSGRQAEALDAFNALRCRLDEELGLEPSQQLRELQLKVLTQDAALAARAESNWAEYDNWAATERAYAEPPALAHLSVDGHEPVPLTQSPWTIGRHPECDLVLADRKASRRHAQIVVDVRGATIVDLGSTNGTRVNGSSITSCTLQDGSLIHIGAHAIQFHTSRGQAVPVLPPRDVA